MRIPKVIKAIDEQTPYSKTIDLENVGHAKKTIYELEDDEKSMKKFIKKVEKIVRGSYEYREYINFLKEEVDMNQCSFFSEIDRKSLQGVRLEIHHTPFTLYDITSIVINKHIQEHTKLNPMLIAEEVMKLHFRGEVGLIPLSLTVHDLVHNGDLFIPIDKVYGNIASFIEEYNAYMTNDQKELFLEIVKHSELQGESTPAVLDRVYTYLNVKEFTKPEKLLNEEIKIG